MLIYGLVFFGFFFFFSSLVSVDLSGFQDSVVPVCFVVGNSGFLLYICHWGF